MKFDFGAPLLGLDDKPIMDGQNVMTLGAIIAQVCLAGMEEPAEKKLRKFKLALLAASECERDISVEDAALIKDTVGKHTTPLAVGRIWQAIEGE